MSNWTLKSYKILFAYTHLIYIVVVTVGKTFDLGKTQFLSMFYASGFQAKPSHMYGQGVWRKMSTNSPEEEFQ